MDDALRGMPTKAERGEIASLAAEKAGIEGRLAAAGGNDFGFLLCMCNDLLDIIEEVGEVKSKVPEKEHASFETKVKFSRKIRRKAKDLRLFEQEVVRAFDSKRITLEHGRKMAAVIKLLKKNDPERARAEAAEFYGLAEMGGRLEVLEEALGKRKAQVERAKRGALAMLSDFEWLLAQPAIESEKASRHSRRLESREALLEIRDSHVRKLESMPLLRILEMFRDEKIVPPGFPQLQGHEISGLAIYLESSGLQPKSCGQLLELAGMSQQKLAHMGLDPAALRREMAERGHFLSQVSALHSSDFLPLDDARARHYLSAQSEEAGKIVARLEGLEKTAAEDGREWERQQLAEKKRKGLAGIGKQELEKSLQELLGLEAILEGRKPAAAEGKKAGGTGLLWRIRGFFR